MSEKTSTPSSFSGIWKYPKGRSDPFRSPVHWIEAKRVDDNFGNMWRVHGKLYDLTNFIPLHPGGADWLRITQGTDITEAFLSSHFVNLAKIDKILAKYYKGEASHPRISPYTFKPNGFYSVLKRKVEPVLKSVGTGPTRTGIIFQDFLAWSFLLSSGMSVWQNSTILQILAGLMLGLNLLCSHNFLHIKDNWRRFYFDLSMMSSYEFRISHVLSHHMYPNTIMDFDIAMMEPFLEIFPKSSKNWMQRYLSNVYMHFLFFFNLIIELLKRSFWIATGSQEFRKENLIVFAQLVVYWILANSFQDALKSWLLIQCCGSYVLAFQGVNASHYHPDCFAEGDGARPDPDFGLCQLDAVREAEHHENDNIFTILTTFGEHSLHHLFPSVDHSKLNYIKPIFKETLNEFCQKHPSLSKWDWFTGLSQQLARNKTKNIWGRESLTQISKDERIGAKKG